jgi:hypothetical protein
MMVFLGNVEGDLSPMSALGKDRQLRIELAGPSGHVAQSQTVPLSGCSVETYAIVSHFQTKTSICLAERHLSGLGPGMPQTIADGLPRNLEDVRRLVSGQLPNSCWIDLEANRQGAGARDCSDQIFESLPELV